MFVMENLLMVEKKIFVCYVGKKKIEVPSGQTVGVICDAEATVYVGTEHGYMDCEDRTVLRLSLWENVFLGEMYNYRKFIFPDKREMCEKTLSLMRELQISSSRAEDKAYTLTHQDRKLLEVCRLLLCNKGLWVIDNVLETIDRKTEDKLICAMQKHKNDGGGILFISRSYRDLSFCDRVICMASRKVKPEHIRATPSCEVLMRATNLCTDRLKNINFKLHKGEILGIVGLKYSGISDIGRTLCGDIRLERGRIRIKGASVKNIYSARKRGIFYICPDFSREQILSVLSCDFDVLIVDGVCIDKKVICEKTRTGAGVIFISSNIEYARSISDRILVVRGGEVTGEFDRVTGTDREEILREVTN